MNLWPQNNWGRKHFNFIGVPGGMFLLISIWIGSFILEFPHATPPTFAINQFGILGQRAPELNLNDWIDADGNPQNHSLPEIMRTYRSGGTPWTVILDPEGRVAYNHFHIEPQSAVALIEALPSKMG